MIENGDITKLVSSDIMKSKLDDVPIPTDLSLAEFILQNVRIHANPWKVAMVASETGVEMTYIQLMERVTTLASSLQRHGLVKGDIVVIVCSNCPEFPVVLLAVLLAGGIVNPLGPLFTAYEITEQVLDVGPKYIFTATDSLGKVEKAVKRCDQVKEVFVIGSSTAYHTTYNDLLRQESSCLQRVPIDPIRDVAVIIYSSGTSGSPKGVMLTHYNIIANILQHSVDELMGGTGRQEVYLCVPPFVHCYGLVIVLLIGLSRGHKLVTVTRFHLDEYLAAIHNYKISILHVAPPIVIQLLRSPLVSKYDLSRVHTILSGAAPLSARLTRQLEAKMTGVMVTQGYGMTEAGPGTHMSPRSKQKPGSVGIVVPNTECKVNDLKTGRELPAHRYGELLVRGPQVMIGYRNNQSQTTATIDEDGWLHTGDVGFYDNDGYFYIVDRLKEIIKYKGFQVSPVWLEGILLDHPLIADAAVVGVPDRDAGQLPRAFVVRTPEGHELTETDVVKYVADHVSPHRQLRGGVVFVATIPKSRTGKIIRRILHERLLSCTRETKSKL